MLIRRCAWCKKILGIKWCWKWGVTDGICQSCFADEMCEVPEVK